MSTRPTVVILDYGSGNLRSAQRALARAGADVSVTTDRQQCLEADGLVIPGVGAFGACMRGLLDVDAGELVGRRLADDRAVLGVCVGMQVLFSKSDESPNVRGLALWPGAVSRLQAPVLPHMGWNTVRCAADSTLLRGVEHERFYFVHSYAVTEWLPGEESRSARVSWSEYGDEFLAVVEQGPLSATQFHPEKSGDAGLVLLRNWVGTLN